MTEHPSRQQLKSFLAKRLTAPEHNAVLVHLEDCSVCPRVLDRLLRRGRRKLPRWPQLPVHNTSDLPNSEFLDRLRQHPPGPDPVPFADPLASLVTAGWLGSYCILERLPGGSVGAVFKGRDDSLNRLVAIKVLLPHLATPDNRRRFDDEARAIAALPDQHIVPVHHVDKLPGTDLPYFVMEFIAGPNLAKQMADAPLDVRAAVTIVRQVALALGRAHDRHLVHRDVKPSNVLLERKGDAWHARLSDFGLVRVLQEGEPSEGRVTRSGDLLGTPPYMSPEQILTPREAGPPSDVYSLGVVLYELLTGRLPFLARTTFELMQQITQGEPFPPHLVNPTVPRALSDVCLQCLQKDPARRPHSAHALAADLEAWLAGQRVRVRLPGPATRLLSWAKRNRAVVALAGVVVVLLLVLAGVTTRYHQAQHESRAAYDATRRQEALRTLERGLTRCEQGEAGRGLLWFAKALELAPEDHLQRACRAQLAAWSPQVVALQQTLSFQDPVHVLALHPDGQTIVTGTERHAQLWDLRSGSLLRTLRATAPITAVAFSPDGHTTFTGARVVECARTSDGAMSGHLRGSKVFPDRPVVTIVPNPTGRLLFTGSKEPFLRRWELPTGAFVDTCCPHRKPILAATLSPDGQLLLTGSDDRTARLWDADKGEPLGPELPHDGEVASVAISPDKTKLLTGCKDHVVRLWDRATSNLVLSCRHKDKVYSVAFSPNANALFSGSKDHTSRLWSATTGEPIAAPMYHPGIVLAGICHPDGKAFLTASEDGVRVWTFAPSRPLEVQLTHKVLAPAGAFTPNGNHFLTGGIDGYVRSWRTTDGKGDPSSLPILSELEAIVFSPDGQTIVTASTDLNAKLWHAATGERRNVSLPHRSSVRAIAFSPDGHTILTGSDDRTARLWYAATGEALGPPLQHPLAVTAVAFSPDGRTFLTGCWDGGIRLWDAASGRQLGDPLHHRAAVVAVAFHPNGHTVLTASRDSSAQLWDVRSRRPLLPAMEHSQPILSAALSPSGEVALTCSEDGTARLWDTATGKPLGPPLRHPGRVRVGAFHPAGHTVLTVSDEGTARLWPIPPPVEGDPERVRLWAEVRTGMELTPSGDVQALSAKTWLERSRQLAELEERR